MTSTVLVYGAQREPRLEAGRVLQRAFTTVELRVRMASNLAEALKCLVGGTVAVIVLTDHDGAHATAPATGQSHETATLLRTATRLRHDADALTVQVLVVPAVPQDDGLSVGRLVSAVRTALAVDQAPGARAVHPTCNE